MGLRLVLESRHEWEKGSDTILGIIVSVVPYLQRIGRDGTDQHICRETPGATAFVIPAQEPDFLRAIRRGHAREGPLQRQVSLRLPGIRRGSVVLGWVGISGSLNPKRWACVYAHTGYDGIGE